MNKKRTRISLLAMTVASGAVMAGYAASAGADADASSATAGGDATAVAGSAKVRTLPIEQYLPTPAEFAKLSQAGAKLQQTCMQGLGFTSFQAPEQAPADPRETFTDLRYGTVDAAQAARSGYKPEFAASPRTAKAGGESAAAATDGPEPSGAVEPALNDAEWLAMTGTTKDTGDAATAKQAAPRQVQGKDVPPGGCIAESTRTLTGGAEQLYADLAQDINGQSFKESVKDPRVTKVFAAWSACMKGKGYDYRDPMQANDDPKFAVPTVSAEEIAVAGADVACKNQTGLVDVWHGAEAQIQQKMINARAKEMDAVKKAKQTALAHVQ